MKFEKIKQTFRGLSISEFNNSDDLDQSEVNAFLQYFDRCKTIAELIEVLEGWYMEDYKGMLKILPDNIYYQKFLIGEIKILSDQITSMRFGEDRLEDDNGGYVDDHIDKLLYNANYNIDNYCIYNLETLRYELGNYIYEETKQYVY